MGSTADYFLAALKKAAKDREVVRLGDQAFSGNELRVLLEDFGHKPTNLQLADIYRDFVNNYLTVETYAVLNNMTTEQAQRLLDLAKELTP